MNSQKTIVYAIIAALIGVLAVGGLLSLNNTADSLPSEAAVNPASAAAPTTVATLAKGSDAQTAVNRSTTQTAISGLTTQTATSGSGVQTAANGSGATAIAAEAGWPRAITDNRGTTTTLAQRPQRIVSLAPSATQILRAIGADSALVAIPREGSDPSESEGLVRLSVYPTPSAEAILALRPDLLVGADITSPAIAERLRSFGLPLVVLSGSDFQGILADIARAGEATGTEATADILTQMLAAQLNEVQTEVAAHTALHATDANAQGALTTTQDAQAAASPRPQTLLFIGETPDYAAGNGSYSADLLQIAGGDNLALRLNQPWPMLSREFILEANPRVLIFTVNPASLTSASGTAGRAAQLAAYLRSDPIWNQLDAVRNDRVYAIDQNLLNVPGPHVGEALVQLRAIIRDAQTTSNSQTTSDTQGASTTKPE